MNILTKNALTFLLAFGLALPTFSQDFKLLAEDAENDQSPNYQDDLKAVWYALDEASDSLWFKIQYYDATPTGDFGLVFGIDTNLVAEDGLVWSGGNQSIKPDVVLTINHVFFFEPFYGHSNHDFHYSARLGDDDLEIIVNIKYSELDGDGKFNFVLGGSQFDVDENYRPTYDQLPSNTQGAISFPPQPSGSEEMTATHAELLTSPNPTDDFFAIAHPESGQITVNDAAGRLVFSGDYQPGLQIDCSRWHAGFYVVLLRTQSGSFSGKILVR